MSFEKLLVFSCFFGGLTSSDPKDDQRLLLLEIRMSSPSLSVYRLFFLAVSQFLIQQTLLRLLDDRELKNIF